MIDWKASGMRVTAFYSTPPSIDSPRIDVAKYWSKLTGEPPIEVKSQPQRGVYSAHGDYKSGSLVVSTDLSALNIIQSFSMRVLPNDDLPNLGPYLPSTRNFSQLVIQRAIRDFPDTRRLAFGAKLFFSSKDKSEIYDLLRSELPFVRQLTLSIEHTSDFIFQLNRRTKSRLIGYQDLILNRLTKWGVAEVVMQTISPGGPSSQSIQLHSLELDLDINTHPGSEGKLEKDMLDKLFEELVEIGIKAAREGDTE